MEMMKKNSMLGSREDMEMPESINPPQTSLGREVDGPDEAMSNTDDNASIPTTMGVKADSDYGSVSQYYHPPLHHTSSAVFQDFVVPQTPAELLAAAKSRQLSSGPDSSADDREMQQGRDLDDISVLTEFSGMDEEEDALSQVTVNTETRTVVTTTTASSTRTNVPGTSQQQTQVKRRSAAVDKHSGLPPVDNGQFKRRRRR
eukprot:Nitzschia sp. Nitz4//scaffold75_size92586//75545//76150//NITZ4_004868-RA/size92586-processed-gene-0.50-mRNA-1//-1//CDS//3329557744//2515//frame0